MLILENLSQCETGQRVKNKYKDTEDENSQVDLMGKYQTFLP